MRLRDRLVWILKALWMQKVRTILSIVGFAIGISAMVLLSAMGEGLRQYVLEEFTQFGTNILAINPGKTETFGINSIINTTRPLSLEDTVAIGRLPGVERIVPVVAGTAQVEQGNRSRYTNVYGVSKDARGAWNLEVAIGRFLPEDDLTHTRAYAVLGSELAEELYGSQPPLGQTVKVGTSRFRVIGVLHPKGDFMGTDLDDAIYIPASRGLQIFNRESLMEIDVFYTPSMPTATIEQNVKNLLIDRHGFEDFTIITQDQMLETMDNILRILKLAGGGLGAISLLVGGVGIATILMITVAERNAEVGLLRALGSTRNEIRNLFIGEAITLGLLGGIAGILVVVLVVIVAWLLAPGLPIVIGFGLVLIALLISMAIGLVAGVNPAMKATRLSPIDALRTE